MEKCTLDSLNSRWTKLYEDNGKLMVGIAMEDIVAGRVMLTVNDVSEDVALEEAPADPFDDTPKVIITDSIKEVYSKLGQDRGNKLYEDVYNYLQLTAECWGSQNRTASAITGSLIGKISKPFSELNELLFKTVGTTARDTYLKELIKVNLPLLNYIWGQKKQ